MKKLFTLVFALMGLVANGNAASVDDVKVCKHSYVLVCDEWTNNGTVRPGKGNLFGDDYFLDVTGGSVATNKKSVDLSVADGVLVTEAIAAKYGEYGSHLNSLRLKNAQDVLFMKVTAGSKLILFYNNNGAERYPLFCKDAAAKEPLDVQGTMSETVENVQRMEWTAPDDLDLYIANQGGDMFLSYIIVEANEAPGTPSVKVGPQTFENGLWFKEVTCKPVDVEMEGISVPSVVTYTTDGTDPTADSPVYKEPIKCYANMIVKFQAFMDALGTQTPMEGMEAPGADNEAAVNFLFDAPEIIVNGADVEIHTAYENADNYYTLADGNGNAIEKDVLGSMFTLDESANVTAWTEITNGEYAVFTTNSVSKDVYVLNPIKEKKTIAVIAGEVIVDEEATANSTTGTVYMVTGGLISADNKDFFVKNLEFAVVKDTQYQINGDERYIKMNNTNITFQVAEGDSVNVKVVTSLNSCKTLNADEDPEVTTDRKNYVNVSGTTYGNEDVTAEGGNIIEFGLPAGTWTFQKYSGTGNIMVSSIEITPAEGGNTGGNEEQGSVRKWDFTNWSEATVANLKADAAQGTDTGWSDDEKNDGSNMDATAGNCFWAITTPTENGELLANGQVIEELKGLVFGANVNNRGMAIAVNYPSTSLGTYHGPAYLWLGGANKEFFTIPAVAGGSTIKIGVESHKSTDARGVQLKVNGAVIDGPAAPTTYEEQTWTIPAGEAVDVVVDNTNGCHIYFIEVSSDANSIQEVVKVISNGAIYNLSGQKVDENYKGVVIKNGKKMLQK